MNIVGAKKCYDGKWWDDMIKLPKPFLVAALERANRRADKAEESAPTSHNTQIMPVCPKCGSGVAVFQGDIIHRCNNDECQWAGKPA